MPASPGAQPGRHAEILSSTGFDKVIVDAGDKHDYFTPAPYYWPNPKNPKGPYIVIDGQRVPGTGLYDDQVRGFARTGGEMRSGPYSQVLTQTWPVLLQSEKYDRSRLSSFYGNTTVLALAGFFTGDDRYTRHAARNLKVWPAVVQDICHIVHDGCAGAGAILILTRRHLNCRHGLWTNQRA
jgi:hypothetical protein